MSSYRHYTKIFDYLSTPQLPTSAEVTIAFGRKDPLVARAIGDLAIANLAEIIVITGGIGKDSGDILEQGFRSEAHYLDALLEEDARSRHYGLPNIFLDEEATNGGENARNSIAILHDHNTDTSSMTAVAHATSAKRLAETLRHETFKIDGRSPNIHIKPTNYSFDPANPIDQKEACAELLRLADWPAKGWLGDQPDLPENLVDFARDATNRSNPNQ